MSRPHDFYKTRDKYTVSAVCEFFKELDVYALNEEEAMQIFEDKLRKSHKVMQRSGFYLGDVDFINVKRK